MNQIQPVQQRSVRQEQNRSWQGLNGHNAAPNCPCPGCSGARKARGR